MNCDDTNGVAAPAQPDRIMAVVEQIAQQWDGCNYEASGEDIDIGEAIRMAGARFADGVAIPSKGQPDA